MLKIYQPRKLEVLYKIKKSCHTGTVPTLQKLNYRLIFPYCIFYVCDLYTHKNACKEHLKMFTSKLLTRNANCINNCMHTVTV